MGATPRSAVSLFPPPNPKALPSRTSPPHFSSPQLPPPPPPFSELTILSSLNVTLGQALCKFQQDISNPSNWLAAHADHIRSVLDDVSQYNLDSKIGFDEISELLCNSSIYSVSHSFGCDRSSVLKFEQTLAVYTFVQLAYWQPRGPFRDE